MKHHSKKVLKLLLLVILAAGPRVGLAHDRVAQVVDAAIRPLMAKDGLPGVAVGIAFDGQSRVFSYGESSLQTHSPVTPRTLFEIGSVSKTFTATLASYAALRGDVALPDPTSKYLPYLRGSVFGDVSVLDLATHTAGGLPLQVPDNIHTYGGLMRYLRAWRPAHPPGTYRRYSNVGVGLLGLVAARSMRRDFTSLLQDELLPGLGLRHTFVKVPAAEMPEYAQGYTSDGRPIRMTPGLLAAEAYGIRSTAGDMIRFLQANMGLLRLNPGLRQAIRATHTGYFAAGALTQDLIWEQYRYPVALKTLLAGNAPAMLFDAVPATRLDPPQNPQAAVWINKTGSTNGFGAYVAFIPQERLGLVILANRAFPIADRVSAAYAILSSLAREHHVTSERQFRNQVPGEDRGARW